MNQRRQELALRWSGILSTANSLGGIDKVGHCRLLLRIEYATAELSCDGEVFECVN